MKCKFILVSPWLLKSPGIVTRRCRCSGLSDGGGTCEQLRNLVLVKGFNFLYHNKEIILFTIDPYLIKGCNLTYQNKETILFTIDPYHGNLN